VKPITGPQMCRLLEENGWRRERIKGSHFIYAKTGERKVIFVPVHASQDLKPGLASRIARDARISW
jgi:predicted RNA binding protein YcfA (HicA-like mRNA interferase family)